MKKKVKKSKKKPMVKDVLPIQTKAVSQYGFSGTIYLSKVAREMVQAQKAPVKGDTLVVDKHNQAFIESFVTVRVDGTESEALTTMTARQTELVLKIMGLVRA